MPKRSTADYGAGSTDSPGVIAGRRKAKVSSKFRRDGTAPAARASPSVFAGLNMNPPKSGFVFGSTDGTGGGSSNSFSLGATSSSTFGSSPVRGTTGGGEGGMPTAKFSSLEKANPPAPATLSKPAEVLLQPAPPAASPQDGATQLKTGGVQQPASPRPRQDDQLTTSSGGTVKSWSGPPFGDGPTAVQGDRLNKLFANWISHQISTNSATPLDVGLRDYVAFAADIRDRVEFSRAGVESTTGTAFKHPSAPIASPTKPPVASTSLSEVDSAAILPPVAAPSSAPAPPPALVVKAAATGLFTQPILPAAPPGPRFAFAATSFSATTAPPAVIAPSTSSPNGGFGFSAGGFGGTGSATPGYQGLFNDLKVPAGIASAPTTAGGPAADLEEDGMPKEDPSKLERAPGEENEEIVAHYRAKLYRFKTDEKTWGDMGVGMLRLMKHTTNDARRVVLRNDMGKVLLNAAMYTGMKVTKRKSYITFVASTGEGPATFMIKVTASEIDGLHAGLLKLVPSS